MAAPPPVRGASFPAWIRTRPWYDLAWTPFADGTPMLVVTLLSRSLEALAADAARAFAGGADAVEVRADHLPDAEPRRLRAAVKGKAVYTLRPVRGGGRYSGEEALRLARLRAAGRDGFEFVDLEADAGISPASLHAPCILSHHGGVPQPEEVDAVLRRLLAAKPFTAKAVFPCRTLAEELVLVEAQRRFGSPVACFAQGASALASRLLARRFGAPLIYAALEPGAEAAPGQPVLSVLRETYRVRRIGPRTRIFALAGFPLGHSLSPAFHNERFEARGTDAFYLPLASEDFAVLWAARDRLSLEGLSVTLPHKESALAAAREATEDARAAGAANTLWRRRPEGGPERWVAANTDVDAIRVALADAGLTLAGKAVLVLGAGGAARAACAAASAAGARLAVAGRTPQRTRALAERFGAAALALGGLNPSGYDVVVNATPVGMTPAADATPLDPARLTPSQAVLDLVYNPRETRLLQGARRRGCLVVEGLSVFTRQAEGQQAIFAGEGGG